MTEPAYLVQPSLLSSKSVIVDVLIIELVLLRRLGGAEAAVKRFAWHGAISFVEFPRRLCGQTGFSTGIWFCRTFNHFAPWYRRFQGSAMLFRTTNALTHVVRELKTKARSPLDDL